MFRLESKEGILLDKLNLDCNLSSMCLKLKLSHAGKKQYKLHALKISKMDLGDKNSFLSEICVVKVARFIFTLLRLF